MDNRPIGIFDSGVGGLTVWKTLLKEFPQESFVYFADNKYCPYGTKSDEEITERSEKIVDFLLQKKCKLIVVACNTATSASIHTLRKKYSVPIVGIEPAIKPASKKSKTGSIGVLATQGTVNGNHFKQTSQKYANDKNVIVQIGYGLVDLVEQNKIDSIELKVLLQKYLKPMLEQNVDYIVLGCTHYPLLSNKIRSIVGEKITLLEPSKAIAKQVKVKLIEINGMAENNKHRKTEIYTSGNNFLPIFSVLKQLKMDKNEKIEIKRYF